MIVISSIQADALPLLHAVQLDVQAAPDNAPPTLAPAPAAPAKPAPKADAAPQHREPAWVEWLNARLAKHALSVAQKQTLAKAKFVAGVANIM